MDALNSTILRRVGSAARRRVDAAPLSALVTASAAAKQAPPPNDAWRSDLSRFLSEARIATYCPASVGKPVNLCIRGCIDQVNTYAATLAAVPGAIAPALLQCVSDVAVLSKLGVSGPLTPASARAAAAQMLTDATARSHAFSDPTQRVALLSVASQDARAVMNLVPRDSTVTAMDSLLSRSLRLRDSQVVAGNRAIVEAASVKSLLGLLTLPPQITEDRVAPPMPLWLSVQLASQLPERRRAFEGLWHALGGLTVEVPRGNELERVDVAIALAKLMGAGILERHDSRGVTLLDNIDQLLRQPCVAPLQPRQLAAEVVAHVAWPGRTMSQGHRLTCAAACLTYNLALTRPSEYVRLVAALASPNGAVRLASGQILRRAPDCETEDGSGRSAAERLMQSSIMALAGDHGSGGVYNDVADGFVIPGGELTQTGVFGPQFVSVINSVMGSHVRLLEHPTVANLTGALRGRTADNSLSGDLVAVDLRWDGQEHWVQLRNLDNGRVYFHNPQGAGAALLNGVDHQRHGDGIESLPLDELAQRARALIRS